MSSRELRVLISLWMRRDRARSVTFHTHELPVERGSRICVSQSKASSLSHSDLRVVPVYSSLQLSSGVERVTDGLSIAVLSETESNTVFQHLYLRVPQLRGVQRGAYKPGASRDADRWIGGETSYESSRLDWLEFCWKRRRFAVSADRYSSDTDER